MPQPDWLARYHESERLRHETFDMNSVAVALEPFGVVRKTEAEFIATIEGQCAYLMVTGRPVRRKAVAQRLARRARGKLVLVRPEPNKASEELANVVRGLEWSTMRIAASDALAEGRSVIADADFSDQGVVQRFTDYCFDSGARGVIAVCLTTMYEEEAVDDGVTGVVWLGSQGGH